MTHNDLINNNLGFIIKIVKNFNPVGREELDEFIQLGRIGFWKAIKAQERNTIHRFKLITIAGYYIKWEILNHIKKNKQQFDISPTYNLDNLWYKKQESLWEILPSSLTSIEKNIINLRLSGYTFCYINKHYKKPIGWSNKIFYTGLEKIQEANEG